MPRGYYQVPTVGTVPRGARVTEFTLLVYKRGYVAYRSDRRFNDLGPRMDFAQTRQPGAARALAQRPVARASPAVRRWRHRGRRAHRVGDRRRERRARGQRPQAGEDLRPGRGEGPYVVAAQLLTETDIKARTKYDGGFETGPLSDEPDTSTYSSQHFKALGRPETWDVAIRVWRLEPGKAQERYDELLTQLPGVAEKDDIAQPVVPRERGRHPRRRLPRRHRAASSC